jgi:hypothetical protein
VRVLTKTQQVKMNFWVRDNAELVDVFLDSNDLGSHGRKNQVSNGHARAFQAFHRYDAELEYD